jgi:hypothetical protein
MHSFLRLIPLLGLLIFTVTSPSLLAANISGQWNLHISSSDLESPQPGSDLRPEYRSPEGFMRLPVPEAGNYRIMVHRIDQRWPNSLKLSVKPAGDQSGTRVMKGQGIYQNIGTAPRNLMTIQAGSASDISVEYRLDGVSASIPMGSYSTIVVYTFTSE